MLTQLAIERYGAIVNRSFDFGPVTLFCGPNEAGKTTIFDALLEAICSPAGSTREGKELRTRYGDRRRAAASFDAGRLSIDTRQFMHLHAIRAGDVTIEVDDSSKWIQLVKARLFSGGIDPGVIIARLTERASPKGTLAHNRELNKKQHNRQRAESELAALRAKREAILARQSAVERMLRETEEQRQKLSAAESELAALRHQLAAEEKIGTRRRTDELLAFLEEGERMERELSALAPFAADATASLDELQQNAAANKTDIGVSEKSLANIRRDIAAATREKEELQLAAGRARRHVELAVPLIERISGFTANPPMVRKTTWCIWMLAVALAAALGGCTGAALSHGIWPRAAFAGGGLAAALLMSFLARRVISIVDQAQRERFTAAIIEDWNTAAANEPQLSRITIEAFLEFLISKKAAAADLQVSLEKAEITLKKIVDRESEEARSLHELRINASETAQRIHEWLQDHNVSSRDDYIKRVAAFQELSQRRQRWQQRLTVYLTERQCETSAELKRLCDRLLRGFDEEGIPLHGKTDAGISALKTTIDRRGQELKRISEELQRQSAELGEQGGEIRGSLGELPQQILGLESQIHEFDRQIDANNIDRLAAGFAAEIFASITRGSDAALQRLSSALGESFAKIAEEPRSALLKRLDSQAISATDSAGIIRPLEQLSTGTRDCFVLAARLALARQASEETSILVLDEPFLSLDEARQSRAVALLRQFQDETGWQIVLMTKEKSLVDKMRAAFAAEQIKEHWLGAA